MTQISDRLVKRYYDEFRDSELNKEYYAARMKSVRKRLRNINIFLALFAGSSAILSFSLWNYSILGLPIGSLSIGALTGIAVIISIAKPYLGMEAEIERISSVQGVYSVLSTLHKDVVDEIIARKSVSSKEEISYDIMRRMRISIDPKEDKPGDPELIDKMQEVVNNRYPKEYFWYPMS